jgi:hypothetical protein
LLDWEIVMAKSYAVVAWRVHGEKCSGRVAGGEWRVASDEIPGVAV